ncbi:MAG: SPASM domain-containing protein [Candidatus Omnitrophica bacterium]|nr:SPASM domain-containing protein [Candidatus Omnitrophota bacterium]
MITKVKRLLQRYFFNSKTTPPQKIFIEITGACNLRCPLCPRTYSSNKRGNMPREVFEKVITDIAADYPNLGLLGFHLFGEITMRNDYNTLVSWARQKLPNTHFGISTTVSLENKKAISNLLLPGFDSIGVWPDGFSDDSYAKIRTGGSFAVVKDNIKFLLEERERLHKLEVAIHVGIIKNIMNQDAIDKFYESFQFVENFKNASLVTVDSIDWAGQVPSENVLYAAKDYIFKIPKPCSVPFEILAVSATGDMTLCCMDMDLALKIGNIMSDGSISQIWASERADTIRRRMMRLSPPALCKECHSFYVDFTPPAMRHKKQHVRLKGSHAIKQFSFNELKKKRP